MVFKVSFSTMVICCERKNKNDRASHIYRKADVYGDVVVVDTEFDEKLSQFVYRDMDVEVLCLLVSFDRDIIQFFWRIGLSPQI